MTTETEVVFLFDVDNTLLDNDRVESDIRLYIEGECGVQSRDRYIAIFEELRAKLGYSDYLGTLQHYRNEERCDPQLLVQMSLFLIDYPFAERLYPRSIDTLKHLSTLGKTVILSDGDVTFQPRKILRSGLWDLRSQRADAGRCSSALPCKTLHYGGRQTAHPHIDEKDLGEPSDYCFPSPGPLCMRPCNRGCLCIG